MKVAFKHSLLCNLELLPREAASDATQAFIKSALTGLGATHQFGKHHVAIPLSTSHGVGRVATLWLRLYDTLSCSWTVLTGHVKH